MTLTLRISQERLDGAGGLKIFVRSWRPEGPVRGVVVIVHGFNSHSGEYGWVAEQLVASRFAVYAPDRLKNEDFSRDPKVVQAKNSDPLIVNEIQPTQTLAEMRADERLRNEFPLITLPVLILHGTADKATRPSGSQRFYDTVGLADKTLKLHEGHFHDLLNDVDKEVVMGDIKAWVADRVAARV